MSKTRNEALAAARETRDYQAIVDYMPYTHHLGITVAVVDDVPIFTLPFQDRLIGNPRLPAIHGGVVAALMEAAALVTVLVDEQQSRLPKPIDYALDYLRSARAEALHARCHILRQGRRVVAARTECWQADPEKLTAAGRVHLLLSNEDAASA